MATAQHGTSFHPEPAACGQGDPEEHWSSVICRALTSFPQPPRISPLTGELSPLEPRLWVLLLERAWLNDCKACPAIRSPPFMPPPPHPPLPPPSTHSTTPRTPTHTPGVVMRNVQKYRDILSSAEPSHRSPTSQDLTSHRWASPLEPRPWALRCPCLMCSLQISRHRRTV